MPETVPCNLCGSADGLPQPKKARFLELPEPFGICRCRRCGLIYQNPRPTVAELAAMYATHPFYASENLTRGASFRPFYASRMERVERWRPERGTMLGIGCIEGGYALEVAQSRGWRVFAIEFSPAFAAHARGLGVRVEVARAWDLSSVAGRHFDVVYSQFMEHLFDPRDTLRQCRQMLDREGLLVLEAPNQFYSLKNKVKKAVIQVGGAKARKLFYGEAGAEFHTYYFDPSTIRALVTSEGFEILELRTYLRGHPVYHFNPRLGWLQELLYAVGGLFDRGPSIELIARPLR